MFYIRVRLYTGNGGGKHTARVKLAREETEFERLALKHFFRELQAEAAEAFVEALIEREVLLSKISSYQYMQQLSISDSIRYQLGEISENDARQSYIEAVTLLNEVFEQEAVYKNVLLQMQQFTGRMSETLFKPVGYWNVLNKTYNLNELVNTAIENRADLIAFEKQIAVSQQNYRLVKAERKPNIDLMVGYEKDWGGILPRANILKGGITIPLKFSNFNKGELKASQFMIEKTQVEYQDALLQVQTEVASALYDYEALDKQLTHFTEDLVENARKVMEGVTYMYQRGETGIIEVLIAQRDYNEIREDYFQKSKEYVNALIQLEKSCGIWNIDF
ncbi:MAG: TolC family protein [Odoribacter sp.]|nr:TolC family protein [Odoribacter sp.]